MNTLPLLLIALSLATAPPAHAADDLSNEVRAAFEKLRMLKSYRQRISMQGIEVGGQSAEFLMKPFVVEMVNPGRSRMVMEMTLPQMYIKYQTIIVGERMAHRVDSPDLERMRDEVQRARVQMMSQAMFGMVMSWVAAATHPIDLAMMGAGLLIQHGMTPRARDEAEPGKWKCRDLPLESTSAEPRIVARRLGEGLFSGTPVTTYKVVLGQGRENEKLHLHVAKQTGLPLAMEIAGSQGERVTIEYLDFNAPIAIELPPCQ